MSYEITTDPLRLVVNGDQRRLEIHEHSGGDYAAFATHGDGIEAYLIPVEIPTAALVTFARAVLAVHGDERNIQREAIDLWSKALAARKEQPASPSLPGLSAWDRERLGIPQSSLYRKQGDYL